MLIAAKPDMPRPTGLGGKRKWRGGKSGLAASRADAASGSSSLRSRSAAAQRTVDVSGVRVSEAERRVAIKVLWVAAGKTLPAEWGGSDGTVSWITNLLVPFVQPAV